MAGFYLFGGFYMFFHQFTNSSAESDYNMSFYTDDIWEYHFHKKMELIYVFKGEVDCMINDKTYFLKSGDFGLCLPYDIHSYTPKENTEYAVLVFSENLVYDFYKKIANKTATEYIFRPKNTIKEYVVSRLMNNKSFSVFTLKSCLYALVDEYLAKVKLVPKNHTYTEMISAVTDFVSENHTKKITLLDLAKELGYDYNYMSRHFKNVFKMNFTDFVNMYRLETAIKLLDETSESVTNVAMNSGFQSVRSFHNFFKKIMKITPIEYRKKHIEI